MRRRIFRTLFALCILLTALSVSLSAAAGETTFSGDGSLNIAGNSTEYTDYRMLTEVSGAYTETSGEDDSAVYRVQIQWGSMKFYYTKIDTKVWNPDTLSYEDSSESSYRWLCPTDSSGARNDQVTVINRSNRAIVCDLKYQQDDENVTATLDNSNFTLASAVGATENTLPTGVSTVSLSGSYTRKTLADFGYVCIKIVPEESA